MMFQETRHFFFFGLVCILIRIHPGKGTSILGQYGYVPPKSPDFLAWSAPEDSTFLIWAAPKDPPFKKYTFVCSTFLTWAAPKDPPFKAYTVVCYF